MTIVEALKRSKADQGSKFMRMHPGSDGHVGWIAWYAPEWVYRLSFEDLTADDWEPQAVVIEKVTQGRYVAAAK